MLSLLDQGTVLLRRFVPKRAALYHCTRSAMCFRDEFMRDVNFQYCINMLNNI